MINWIKLYTLIQEWDNQYCNYLQRTRVLPAGTIMTSLLIWLRLSWSLPFVPWCITFGNAQISFNRRQRSPRRGKRKRIAFPHSIETLNHKIFRIFCKEISKGDKKRLLKNSLSSTFLIALEGESRLKSRGLKVNSNPSLKQMSTLLACTKTEARSVNLRPVLSLIHKYEVSYLTNKWR